MASIVRIKRRQSQEPAEALLLAAKRPRTSGCASSSSDSISVDSRQNVFKFCGTISDERENPEEIGKLIEKSKSTGHRHSVKTLTRAKVKPAKQDLAAEDKKYKILSSFRHIDGTDLKVYDLVLEDDLHLCSKPEVVTCNGVPLTVECCEPLREEGYVYDYYYSEHKAFDDTYIDQLLSVQPYFYEPDEDEDEELDVEDEDSNDENYWANDYPDEEDGSDSDDCDILVSRMNRMHVGGDEKDLSSDDDDFIYSRDDDEPLRGDAYERYMKRVTKHLSDSFDGDDSSVSGSVDEEDDD